jgi:hypothetical protein
MPIADAGGLGRFEAKRALNGAAFFREKARLYGVLSLTEKSDSIPMWTHYAAAHTGFVIAFDTASEAFRTALEEKKLCQVQYQDKRPDLARYPTTIFWTKSRDWEYEQEWRWLESDDPSEYADVVAAPNGELLYLRSIPPQSIRAVILGLRTTSAVSESVQTLLAAPDCRHVELQKVFLDEGHYKLRVGPLPR